MKPSLSLLALCLAAIPSLVSAQAIAELTGSVPDGPVKVATEMPGDGLNQAAGVCGGLSFDNNRARCMRTVNSARFFEPTAVQVCAGRSFDDGKIACLAAAANHRFQPDAVGVCGGLSFDNNVAKCIGAAADKAFLPAEVSACGGASFDDGKISCLANGGRPIEAYPPEPPRDGPRDCRETDAFILRSLRGIQSDLRRGDVPLAVMHVAELIHFVDVALQR